MLGVAADGTAFPIDGYSGITLYAQERMRLLVKYAPLIFTTEAKDMFLSNIQNLFEMIEDPISNLPAINATVIDRSLVLCLSEIWKWRVDFVLGREPPKFMEFVDMLIAAKAKKYPGLQIVAYAFDSWLRGNLVPLNRGRPRACDILKSQAAHSRTKTKLSQKERKELKRNQSGHQDYAPLTDEQAASVFEMCAECDYPQIWYALTQPSPCNTGITHALVKILFHRTHK